MHFVPNDPYDQLLAGSGILLLLFGLLLLWRRPWRKQAPFPYQLRRIGNGSQRQWLPLLAAAVGDEFDLLPVVRLEDLLLVDPQLARKAAVKAGLRLQELEIDFLLLAPGSLDPLAAVLLQTGAVQEAFRSAALLAAGIPIVQLPAEPLLEVPQLQDLLRSELGRGTLASADGWSLGATGEGEPAEVEWSLGEPAAVTPAETVAAPPRSGWPACPECGAERTPRRVSSGRHAGKLFLVCRNYPDCSHLQPLSRRQD